MTLSSLLFPLILKGSLALLAALLFQRLFGRILSAKNFKILFLSGFLLSLLPLHLFLTFDITIPPQLKTIEKSSSSFNALQSIIPSHPSNDSAPSSPLSNSIPWSSLILSIWGIGAFISLIRFFIQTQRTSKKFSTLPQSTQSFLLQELESCKKQAGTFAPVGIIESVETKTPAILGWLRPRILLSQGFTDQWSSEERQSVFLHELAHFCSADALGLTVARIALAIHWWNPLFHWAYQAYRKQIEFAADEFVIQKGDPSAASGYPSLLLKFSLSSVAQTEPLGALGIRENYETLKQRIEMIQNQSTKKESILTPLLFCLSITLFLGLALFSWSEDQSASTTEAEQAAIAWLTTIDQGQYKESHVQSSQLFKEEITSKKWVEALDSVRKPLGKLLSRKILSKMIQQDIPNGKKVIKGTFCIIQAQSSFQNLNSSMETISLQRESDGQWRATGYFIKPK